MLRIGFRTAVLALGLLPLLAACAGSSHVLLGKARSPISPDEVMLYEQAPEGSQQIAEIEASSAASLKSAQEKVDRAIEGLKREAARLGANGIILDDVEDDEAHTAVGTTATTSDGTPVYLDVGSSASLLKTARGLAIYVPPDT